MICEKCGAEIENGFKFCIFCGAKINYENNNEICEQEAITEKDNANCEQEAITENNNANCKQEATTENNNAICKQDTIVENEKYTGNEMLEKIGKFITIGLSAISVIMLIGGFLGILDKNPIPFIIFIGVVSIFEWLENKFPKVPTIVVAVLEIVAIIVCFNVANDVGTVESVKGGCPDSYPNITYERAFNAYFSNPKWKSAGEDEDGNKVVKFTGSCYYLEEKAVVEIKFTIFDSQERFVVSSVKLNGVDIGIWGDGLIMDVFEKYQNSH